MSNWILDYTMIVAALQQNSHHKIPLGSNDQCIIADKVHL